MIASAEDLRALIREIADAVAEPDPATVADKVLGQLSSADRKVALMACFPGYVSDLLRREAALARQRLGRPEPVEVNGVKYASPRVAAVHQDVLRTQFHAGSEWKWFGECTAADLDAAAVAREESAAALSAEAARWRALAKYMRGHKLAVVADVPRDQLERFLARGAA